MSLTIEHLFIEDLLAQHEGCWVRAVCARKGKMAPPAEGKVPEPYDYELQQLDGSSVPFPARGVQYLEVTITAPDGELLQRVLPSASASSERAQLAQMLADAKAERLDLLKATHDAALSAQNDRDAAMAKSEQQRLAMMQAAAQAAVDAKADRDALALQQCQRDATAAAERNQLMMVLSALSSASSAANSSNTTPSRTLGYPAGTTAGNPIVIGSGGTGGTTSTISTTNSSVVALPPDLVALMRRREDDDSKVFSSHESPRCDFFLQQHIQVLKLNLPEYRWTKANPHAIELRAAARTAADSLLENAAKTHEQHLASVITAMIAAGRAATPQLAAELQIVMAIAATASGILDWPRVAIAELAVLGNRAIPLGTLERLKQASTPSAASACSRWSSPRASSRKGSSSSSSSSHLDHAAHAERSSVDHGPRKGARPGTPSP